PEFLGLGTGCVVSGAVLAVRGSLCRGALLVTGLAAAGGQLVGEAGAPQVKRGFDLVSAISNNTNDNNHNDNNTNKNNGTNKNNDNNNNNKNNDNNNNNIDNKPPPPPLSRRRSLLALASGLRLGGAGARHAELGLLRDFLLGQAGGPQDRQAAASIVRLVVAGGLHADAAEPEPAALSAAKRPRWDTPATALAAASTATSSTWGRGGRAAADAAAWLKPPPSSPAVAAADEADLFLAPLAFAGLTLSILSGEGDCGVNSALPQPPLPGALLPRCRGSNRLELWANPCCHELGNSSSRSYNNNSNSNSNSSNSNSNNSSNSNNNSNNVSNLCVLGHAGQPVSSLINLARAGKEALRPIDALSACWHCSHLAPTWPDHFASSHRGTGGAGGGVLGVPGDPFVLNLKATTGKACSGAGKIGFESSAKDPDTKKTAKEMAGSIAAEVDIAPVGLGDATLVGAYTLSV
ncbi:unnamed protein product, partial [Polarella glacialis]